MKYATTQRRPRDLYRVCGKDGSPLPGLHETIGQAAEAAAFADVTEPNFPYRIERVVQVVPSWMGKRVA